MMSTSSTSPARPTPNVELADRAADGRAGSGYTSFDACSIPLEYEYSEAERRSRIRFRKNAAESPASGGAHAAGGPGCSRLTGKGPGVVVLAGRLDAAECPARPGGPRRRPRHRDPRLHRPRVHLERRPGRPPQDPEAPARRRTASCGSRASTATCGTSSCIRASTRSSRSSPLAEFRPTFPGRRV